MTDKELATAIINYLKVNMDNVIKIDNYYSEHDMVSPKFIFKNYDYIVIDLEYNIIKARLPETHSTLTVNLSEDKFLFQKLYIKVLEIKEVIEKKDKEFLKKFLEK